MKLVVLVLCGYLAVSTNAAGGYALAGSSSNDAEAKTEAVGTQQAAEDPGLEDAGSKDGGQENSGWKYSELGNLGSETAGPDNVGSENVESENAGSGTSTSDDVRSDNAESENAGSEGAGGETAVRSVTESDTSLQDVNSTMTEKISATATNAQTTGLDKNAGTELSSDSEETLSGQISVLDIIPYPLNVILRTFGKDALKNFDVETMCDTVQLVDWKNYKKLLEIEDFAGFKDKIVNDEIITATVEAIQKTSESYMNKILATFSKSIKIGGLDNLQESLKEFLSIMALNSGIQNAGANFPNNIKSFADILTMDKKGNIEVLENFQTNLEKLIDVLSLAKTKNNVKITSKNELSGYNKGAPAA